MVKVVVGSDHRGFKLKQHILALLGELGYEYEGLGCYDETPVDYPDPAERVARKVSQVNKIRNMGKERLSIT